MDDNINKKKRGFTLIELLAVIVILAIIVLIATPIILGVIESSRRKAFEDTGYGVVEGIRHYYVNKLHEDGVVGDAFFTFPDSGLKLTGTVPAGGNARLYADGRIEIAIHDNRWCATKAANESEVKTVDYVKGECKLEGTSEGGTQGGQSGSEGKVGETVTLNFMGNQHWKVDQNNFSGIIFVNNKNVPSDAVDSWDASEKQNGSVMAWITSDNDRPGKYIIYIGSDGKVNAPVDSSGLFYNRTGGIIYGNLQIIDVSNLSVSHTTNMASMFAEVGQNAQKIEIKGLSTWDTSKVTNMSKMFQNFARNSQSLSFSLDGFDSWNTQNVEDMSYMFNNTGTNSKIWDVKGLSNWNTSNVKNMEGMFQYAGANVEKFNLDLSNWKTTKVTNMNYMFQSVGTNAQTSELKIKNFDFSKVSQHNSIFQGFSRNAKVYVGNQKAQDFILNLDSSNRPSEWNKNSVVIS